MVERLRARRGDQHQDIEHGRHSGDAARPWQSRLMTMSPPVLVIAGPTASGKSGLALALAEQLGGALINADAMQLYRELRILTARPGAGDLARAPHHLYGVLAATDACSAARWRDPPPPAAPAGAPSPPPWGWRSPRPTPRAVRRVGPPPPGAGRAGQGPPR